MSCFLKYSPETDITIPQFIDINGITYYDIKITVGNVYWNVQHRFRQFVDLHEKLISGRSISRDLLPPKKVFFSFLYNLFNKTVYINKNLISLGNWKSESTIFRTTSI